MDGVVGVVGGSGGVGASTFAAVLAGTAGDAILLDVDGIGGGIDVRLGIEHVAGARWSQLRLGGGRLDPELLEEGLPRWGTVPVLAADAGYPDAEDVGQVVDAASALGLVVLDAPRAPCPARAAALDRCALVIVVVGATVPGVAAARAVVDGLPAVPLGIVVRRGPVRAQEVGRLVGAPLLGVLPGRLASGDRALQPGELPTRVSRVASGVLDGLAGRALPRHPGVPVSTGTAGAHRGGSDPDLLRVRYG